MKVLFALIPELILFIGAVILFLTEPFTKKQERYFISSCSLLVVCFYILFASYSMPENVYVVLSPFFIFSRLTQACKILLGIILGITLLLWTPENEEGFRFELFPMILLSGMGLSLLMSSYHILMVIISLELLSISLYILIAASMKPDKRSLESAIKYFVTGSVAAAFILMGAAVLYPFTGGWTDFGQMLDVKNLPALGLMGLALVISGFFFKISAAPFHFWTPDVYEGSPLPLVGYMATAVKLSGIVLLLQFLRTLKINILVNIQNVVLMISMLSLLIANTLALFQKNIKRLLAYSSISHLGMILLGIYAIPAEKYFIPINVLFYFVAYTFMTLGAFTFLIMTNSETIDDISGMINRHPLLTGAMTLFMISLTGLPPTIGFNAKLFIMMDLIHYRGLTAVPIALFAIFMSVISSFYYLGIVRAMFFDPLKSHDALRKPLDCCIGKRMILFICFAGVIIFGCYPSPVLSVIQYLLQRI